MTGAPLADADRIGRGIFSSRQKKQAAKGEAPPGLFLDAASPGEISVHRLTRRPGEIPAPGSGLAADEALAAMGDRDAAARSAKSGTTRTFYGWGELSAQDAAQNERRVRASPLPENQQHADIVLPAAAAADEEERWEHAEELAACAVWRPRPSAR